MYEERMMQYQNNLSLYACKDSDAIRLKAEEKDIRTDFFRDIDRVIYSLSYTRYIDKTQVFTKIGNDNISKRMTHVQMVSKIGRTIGRALGLNEDLIEAAALGHDLGHVPFGHYGETILNKLSLKYNEGYFNHNVQSVRTLMVLEDNGKGKNLTVQVLDAILCHNGEFVEGEYYPEEKTVKKFLDQYEQCYKDKKVLSELRPMTLEGCVVRISDVIAYIGKDIEDAIRIGFIKEEDIPCEILENLGKNNREIVNTIIMDIIKNSDNKSYIKMSDKIYKSVLALKKFNYEKIYLEVDKDIDKLNVENKFNKLFELYLKQVNNNEKDNDIYIVFLNYMSNKYLETTTNERKVIDFIAGMTDEYFLNQYNKYFSV